MKYISTYIILVYFISLLGCSSQKDSKSSVIKGAGNSDQTTSSQAYQADTLFINTSDGLIISANYFYKQDTYEVPQPLVILIHQFMQTKEQWSKSDKADFIDSLTNSGFKVLTYDIRGHGQSSPVQYKLNQLLTDPEGAPRDIEAVFKWTRFQKGIDTARIAVIGTSIGGGLACYASYFLGAKTIIGISNGQETYEKFLGIDPRMMNRVFKRITSVLLICGNQDDSIEAEEKYLMDQYIGDPKEMKVFDSYKHGIFLLQQYPKIYTAMLDWLKRYL